MCLVHAAPGIALRFLRAAISWPIFRASPVFVFVDNAEKATLIRGTRLGKEGSFHVEKVTCASGRNWLNVSRLILGGSSLAIGLQRKPRPTSLDA
ncbi:hypothetical protein DIRU0_D33606 [Diutina rugosa]